MSKEIGVKVFIPTIIAIVVFAATTVGYLGGELIGGRVTLPVAPTLVVGGVVSEPVQEANTVSAPALETCEDAFEEIAD